MDRALAAVDGDFLSQYPELRFPYEVEETGRCSKLDAGNRCTVYNNRPLICNIAKMRVYFDHLTDDQFISINKRLCNDMMDEDGVPKSYRI